MKIKNDEKSQALRKIIPHYNSKLRRKNMFYELDTSNFKRCFCGNFQKTMIHPVFIRISQRAVFSSLIIMQEYRVKVRIKNYSRWSVGAESHASNSNN